MINVNADQSQPGDWKRELQRAFTRVDDLLSHLGLDSRLFPEGEAAARDFPLRAPRGFVALMEPGNPQDPLLRQVLPLAMETRVVPGFSSDPVGDTAALRGPGVLKKYQGRWLVLTTGACAVHCRYCFRRHFSYEEAGLRRPDQTRLIETLGADPDLSEVILSGGDPLMLDDETLSELLAALHGLPQVRRIRLHTRLPIVLPERITPGLCRLLGGGQRVNIVVVQVNHPRELSPAVRAGLRALRREGVTLLNQAVLLAGVNDTLGTLAALSEALIEVGILPYYLHQLDPVQGAAHFAVPDADARTLMAGLLAHLPGYLVPRLVREVAGAPSKLPLC